MVRLKNSSEPHDRRLRVSIAGRQVAGHVRVQDPVDVVSLTGNESLRPLMAGLTLLQASQAAIGAGAYEAESAALAGRVALHALLQCPRGCPRRRPC